MTQQTFNSLRASKTIGATDLFKVTHDKIQVEQGFNERHDRQELQDHINGMVEFLRAGGDLPPIVLDADLRVRDGHCRHAAYGIRIAAGEIAEDAPIYFLPFRGTDVDAIALIASSNNGLALTPMERSRVYKRLSDAGLSNTEIANKVGRSRAHVDQMLLLAGATEEVHERINSGQVSPTEAVKIVREHGANAGEVIKEAAEKSAKGKATGKSVSRAKSEKQGDHKFRSLLQACRGVIKAIPEEIRERIILGTLNELIVDASLFAEIIEAAAAYPEEVEFAGANDDQLDMLKEE